MQTIEDVDKILPSISLKIYPAWYAMFSVGVLILQPHKLAWTWCLDCQ
jgi:hypothetical protein